MSSSEEQESSSNKSGSDEESGSKSKSGSESGSGSGSGSESGSESGSKSGSKSGSESGSKSGSESESDSEKSGSGSSGSESGSGSGSSDNSDSESESNKKKKKKKKDKEEKIAEEKKEFIFEPTPYQKVMNAIREINFDLDGTAKIVDNIEFKYKSKKTVGFDSKLLKDIDDALSVEEKNSKPRNYHPPESPVRRVYQNGIEIGSGMAHSESVENPPHSVGVFGGGPRS